MKIRLIPQLQKVMGFQVAYVDPKNKSLVRLGFLKGDETIDLSEEQAKLVMSQHNAFEEVKVSEAQGQAGKKK